MTEILKLTFQVMKVKTERKRKGREKVKTERQIEKTERKKI
jgi:hypothetical protein